MSLIKLSFPHSKAKFFPDLLKRCESFDTFSKSDLYQIEINEVSELLKNWSDFMVIATRLPKLKGSSAWLMDEPVLPFKPEFFYKIQDSLYYCYNEGYKQTSHQGLYCEGEWGCKQLNEMTKYHSDNRWDMARHWYRYGKFDGLIWKVDKGAIFHALRLESKNKKLNICPAFDIQKIKDEVDRLPDEIVLDDNWTILTRTELTVDGFKEVPFAIIPVDIDVYDEPIEPVDWSTKSEKEINDFLDRWLKLKELE
jgi:hypothetical protein